MKKIFLLLSIVTLVIVTSCSESPEKYNARAHQFADTVNSSIETHFYLASQCATMWRSIIFDYKYIHPITSEKSSFYGNFNEGIAKYKEDIAIIKSKLELDKKYIDSVYTTLKEAPKDSKSTFDNIKELLSIYDRIRALSYDPEGSLNTYSETVVELSNKYKELKSKIDIDKR